MLSLPTTFPWLLVQSWFLGSPSSCHSWILYTLSTPIPRLSGLSGSRVPGKVEYFPFNILGLCTWVSGQNGLPGIYKSFQTCWTQEINAVWPWHRIWSQNDLIPICFCHSPDTWWKMLLTTQIFNVCVCVFIYKHIKTSISQRPTMG